MEGFSFDFVHDRYYRSKKGEYVKVSEIIDRLESQKYSNKDPGVYMDAEMESHDRALDEAITNLKE